MTYSMCVVGREMASRGEETPVYRLKVQPSCTVWGYKLKYNGTKVNYQGSNIKSKGTSILFKDTGIKSEGINIKSKSTKGDKRYRNKV